VRRLGALLLAAGALSACGSEETGGLEAQVDEELAAFPSDAQPEGAAPWPEGRFAGDCTADPGGQHLCFYEDASGRQGWVCLTLDDELRIVDAAGAHDPRRRFDHDGRAFPPDNDC
jgi:hypothetical protein